VGGGVDGQKKNRSTCVDQEEGEKKASKERRVRWVGGGGNGQVCTKTTGVGFFYFLVWVGEWVELESDAVEK
jgi:hypothetical protein